MNTTPNLTSVVEAMWRVISPATFRGAIADCKCVLLRAWVSTAGGGRGTLPQSINQRRTSPSPEIWIFQCLFSTFKNFAFPNIFKIKCPKSEEKLNFWVRQVALGVWIRAPPPKIIGDALGRQEEYGLVSSENVGVVNFGKIRRQIWRIWAMREMAATVCVGRRTFYNLLILRLLIMVISKPPCS